MRYFSDALKT